jgi:hypothetical protein
MRRREFLAGANMAARATSSLRRSRARSASARRPPIGAHDSAPMSAIMPLSERSVAPSGTPVEAPDFARGRWQAADRGPLFPGALAGLTIRVPSRYAHPRVSATMSVRVYLSYAFLSVVLFAAPA